MASPPLIPVNLATIAIESLLYGAYFVLTATSLSLSFLQQQGSGVYGTLTSPHPRRICGSKALPGPMFLGAVALFIVITAHWILTVIRIFDAFVNFRGGSEPEFYFADLSQMTEVVKTGFLIAALVISDTMIIYRLWIVWGCNKLVIIFPLLTLLGLLTCGVGITYQFARYDPFMDAYNPRAGRWVTGDVVFTLCTNGYSTAMIAWRVWKTNRNVSGITFGSSNLLSILAVFVESAAIYTTWTFFFFIAYETHSNLQFTGADSWPSIAGIAFMLIDVRVKLQQQTQTPSPTTVTRFSYGPGMRPPSLAVNIAQVIDRDDSASAYDTRGKRRSAIVVGPERSQNSLP